MTAFLIVLGLLLAAAGGWYLGYKYGAAEVEDWKNAVASLSATSTTIAADIQALKRRL